MNICEALPDDVFSIVLQWTGQAGTSCPMVNKTFRDAAERVAKECLTVLRASSSSVIQKACSMLPTASSLTCMKVFYQALKSQGYDIPSVCRSFNPSLILHTIDTMARESIKELLKFSSISKNLSKLTSDLSIDAWLENNQAVLGQTQRLAGHYTDELTCIPGEFISMLPQLKDFRIQGCSRVTILPDSLYSCDKLKFLNINNTPIRELSAKVGQLTSLRTFCAEGSALTTLPEEISSLPLNYLSLPRLSKVPDTIVRCANKYIRNHSEIIRFRGWYGPILSFLKSELFLIIVTMGTGPLLITLTGIVAAIFALTSIINICMLCVLSSIIAAVWLARLYSRLLLINSTKYEYG